MGHIFRKVEVAVKVVSGVEFEFNGNHGMNPSTQGQRQIGLFSLIALVVANMIGAGVFTTSGFALGDLRERHWVLLAWVIAGVIAMLGAVCYGALARTISDSGGEYIFLRRNVHPLAGFLAGWVSLWAGFTGAIAFAAKGFETYARAGHDWLDGIPQGSIALMAIWVFAILHALRLHTGLITQNLIVIVKLVLLLSFLAFAAIAFGGSSSPGWQTPDLGWETPPTTWHLLSLLAGSLVWISLSYSGYNAAVYVAGEVRDAPRNVPRSMLWAAGIVTVFYVALNAVFLYAPLPNDIVGQESIATIAAGAIGGSFWQVLLQVIICLSLLSSVSSMLIAGPRVYAKMADDGLFPRLFAGRPEQATPQSAVYLQASLTSVAILISTLQQLLDYLSLTLSISAALTVLTLLWMKPTSAQSPAPLGTKLAALMFVGATITLAILAGWNSPEKWLGTAVTLAVGVVVYGLMSLTKNRQ